MADYDLGDDSHVTDADFGALEMFDSNAAMTQSSAVHQAPMASMNEEPAARTKKSKKKRGKNDASSLVDGDDASGGKKKRKYSNDADGKRRKKRRPVEDGEAAEAMDDLRLTGPNIYDVDVNESADVVPATQDDDVQADDSMDLAQQFNNDHDNQVAKALVLENESREQVETLAREAWNEHMSGEQQDQPSYEMPDVPQQTTPKRARSTRKKAKPTFFEAPPEINEDENALVDELPSPSAMTPKPRARKKKPARGRKPLRPQDENGEGIEHKGPKNANHVQGRFSAEEFERLDAAVNGFRDEHEITTTDVNEMIQAAGGTSAGEMHAALWVRMFAEVPDRHRQKVINVARKRYHNFTARGTWTQEQEAELAALIAQHGAKWSYIAGLINRHPEDIRDRFRNYIVCGTSQRKEAWDEQEERRLTQYIIEAMDAIDDLRQAPPNRQMMEKSYEELIDWQDISERMERTRSRLQCITKWKAMNIRTHGKDKLASSQPDSQVSFRLEKARRQLNDMPEEERYRLVLAISASSAGIETKIPWHKLVDKEYRSQWHKGTLSLLWRRLKQAVPDWQRLTVRDCATYLVDQYSQTGQLPEIPDEQFDDEEEAGLLVATTTPGPARKPRAKAAKTAKTKSAISDEMVVDSDHEAAGEIAEGSADPAATMDMEMQIDPALTEALTGTPATPTPKPKRSRAKKSRTAGDGGAQLAAEQDQPEEAEAPTEEVENGGLTAEDAHAAAEAAYAASAAMASAQQEEDVQEEDVQAEGVSVLDDPLADFQETLQA